MTEQTATFDMSSLVGESRNLKLENEKVAIEVKDWDLFYGTSQALKKVNMVIPEKRVTAFIGPSGCGKSTLLRCFNRMNDLVDIVSVQGKMELYGEDMYDKNMNVADLRRKVGMVFQKPNPFPKSIYENVAYGLRLQGVNSKSVLDDTVEWALKGAGLWKEVSNRLH